MKYIYIITSERVKEDELFLNFPPENRPFTSATVRTCMEHFN